MALSATPEPEAPITKYVVCMCELYLGQGSFFNIATPPMLSSKLRFRYWHFSDVLFGSLDVCV
jgi:hypothetical protein